MDKTIPIFYKGYGDYVNSLRALPSDIDGLKPVERRVLLTTYNIAKDKYVKSQKVVGNTIANWHPHGDCYSTLVQMVRQGFILGQGNWGSDTGIEPTKEAAYRYTECKSSNFLNSMLKLVKHVPWDYIETDDKEPVYLPVIFPMCLLGNKFTTGIGFGYKNLTPCYKYEDLFNRLLYLLGKRDKVIISPHSNCDVLSSNKDLENLLVRGSGAITFQGRFEINKSQCKIMITSIPPNKRFSSILSKTGKKDDIGQFFSNGEIGYIDLSSDGKTKIQIEVIRVKNKYDIFDKVVASLTEALTSSISFDIVVVDKYKKVKTISVDDFLLNSYNMYVNCLTSKFEWDKNIINEEIKNLELLEKIRPYLKSNMDISSDVEKIIKKVSKESGEDIDSVNKLITKYMIRKLFSLKTDTKEYRTKVSEIDKKLSNINEVVLQNYKVIMDNYIKEDV